MVQTFHFTLANTAGALFNTEAIACFSCFQRLAQEPCHSSKALLSCNLGAVQVCICQCITSWLLFQVRDKEGAKQDLQNHALAYKRRELQVGSFHFLCTSCDAAAPCHVWPHPPSDFTQQVQMAVIAICYLLRDAMPALVSVLYQVLFLCLTQRRTQRRTVRRSNSGRTNKLCSDVI